MQELVCIRQYSDIREAKIAEQFLIANGIQANLFHSGIVSYYGFELPSQARLMVISEQQEKALKLLNEIQQNYNKTIPKRTIASNIWQYIAIIVSAVILSVTNFLGILILAPISRFLKRVFQREKK